MEKTLKRWALISSLMTLLMPVLDAIFKLLDQYKDEPPGK